MVGTDSAHVSKRERQSKLVICWRRSARFYGVTEPQAQALHTAQRAMVASRLANLTEGRPKNAVEISIVSQTEAANLLNVSRESVVSAQKVLEQGSEELIQKVDVGEIAVRTATRKCTCSFLHRKILNNPS